MSNDDQATACYQFSSAVDVLAGFKRLGIEHLEISNKRPIVIYQRTIFNFNVLTGHLDTAETVEVEVFDISPDLDAETDPVSLIEHLIGELTTTASVDWSGRADPWLHRNPRSIGVRKATVTDLFPL